MNGFAQAGAWETPSSEGPPQPAEPASGAAARRKPVSFNPHLLIEPGVPPDSSEAMVRAVREHLKRYGNHQSAKNALARIEDPQWLAAWDVALRAANGRD